MANDTVGPAKSRYSQLLSERRPFEDRARAFAALTVPYLMPPEGHDSTESLPTPFQSVGSGGVNTLAAKLVLSILPTNSLFFRMDVDDNTEEELKAYAQEAGVDASNIAMEIRENLSRVERVTQKWIEGTALRILMNVTMKHLISSGNYLLQVDMSKEEPTVRGYRIDQYVVARSPRGEVIEIIIREMVDPATLSEEIRKVCDIAVDKDKEYASRTLELYTSIRLDGKEYKVFQEINGIVVPESEGSYKKDRLPFLPLCWERESSEHYGRSYVEQYVGDLITCEGLSQSLNEGAAASSKVVFMVNPNGYTKKRTLADAPNCAIISGSAEDVSVLQTGKMADFQVAKAQLGEITQRLGRAFIMQDSVQRDAERVTAEEIRMMAEMLDQQLGGVYARMSRELQRPLADIILRGLEKSGRIDKIPSGSIKIQIITGIEALGRGQELQALRGAITDVVQVFGPEGLQYFNPSELISRIFHGYGAKPDGVVKSAQQLQQEQQAAQQAQQQAQQMELAGKVAPAMMKGQNGEAPPQ